MDCAYFHGSSGSPAFHFDPSSKADRKGNIKVGGIRLKFIGILWSDRLPNNVGLIIPLLSNVAAKSVSLIPLITNLGCRIGATEFFDFEKFFEQHFKHLNAQNSDLGLA